MRVVAVVCTFWPERLDNVDRIVQDLLAGTHPPDRVIVLDNGTGTRHFIGDRVDVVEAWNTETRGKYVVGLLDPADYYVLCDDDTSVGRDTVRTILQYADEAPGDRFVSGFWGVTLDPTGSFSSGTIHTPAAVTQPLLVDAFHGRVVVASWSSLVAMLEVESRVRIGTAWTYAGDDVLIGLANPGASWLLPLRDDAAFVELDPGGVAMQDRPDYFSDRDAFCRHALARLRPPDPPLEP